MHRVIFVHSVLLFGASMKKQLFTITLTTILCFFLCIGCNNKSQTTQEEQWSVRMVRSEMKRSPQAWMLNFSQDLSWNYCHGLVCSAILETGERYNITAFYDYVEQYADTMVLDGGHIIGYRTEDYTLTGINPGIILYTFYHKEKKKKYESALHLLRNQLRTHPRTSEGGFWHRKVMPSQIWLDCTYLALPFYAQYAHTFNEPSSYDDVVQQVKLIRKHLYDTETGLYRHGWDESHQQQWTDSIGRSSQVWGRSLGWFAMGVVDLLDYLPQDHSERENIITIYQELMTAVLKYQNKDTGVWNQVVDKPAKDGNYPESSVSCMLTYAILKGVRKGYLTPDPFRKQAQNAYNGILKQFITEDENHTLSIKQCCEVAGLGGKPYRDGSYEYYIQTPIRENDPKAVGSFILASLEIEHVE